MPRPGRLLRVDVSYGGNFYAIVDPQENFKGLEHYSADQLISWSRVCASGSMKPTSSYIRTTLPSIAVPISSGQGNHRPESHGPECSILWRQGHRPVSLRYRYLGPDGAMVRQRKVKRRRSLYSRKHHRLQIHRPGGKGTTTVGGETCHRPQHRGMGKDLWVQYDHHRPGG